MVKPTKILKDLEKLYEKRDAIDNQISEKAKQLVAGESKSAVALAATKAKVKSAAKNSVTKKAAAKKPAGRKPGAKKTVAKKPITKKLIAKKPAKHVVGKRPPNEKPAFDPVM